MSSSPLISVENMNTPNTTAPGLLVRTETVPPHILASLGLDARSATCVEISAGNELYQMVCAHLIESRVAKSFTLDIGSAKSRSRCCDDSDDDENEDDPVRVATKDLGLGVFAFTFEEKTFYALHSTLGEVVGTNCGPAILKSLVLIGDGDGAIDTITRFCDGLIARADETSTATFSIYRWHVQYSYWRKAEVVKARPVESVVLPTTLKNKVVDDMGEFVSPSTREWYSEHGVPYKRSYLLHGSPGAGKTSLIAALAGKFRRNVCYFSSLSHPEMTDDNLKAAVQRVPAKSILVLEDVDALFSDSDGRRKRDGDKSALTFSGVLNALDGVGASTGQIFVLTTNHRERLDPALIRCGRVDVHLEFKDASEEQMRLLFAQFYKAADASLAAQFQTKLCALLGEKSVSMAQLQHYFTMMRRQPAEAAAEQVHKVLEEAEAHGLALPDKSGKGEPKKSKGDKGSDDDDDEEEEEEDSAPAKNFFKKGGGKAASKVKKAGGGEAEGKPKATAGGKEIHVHVHVD